MKKISTLLILLFFAQQGYAQLAIEWQKQLGGSGEDQATAFIQTSDGGFLAFGQSSSNNGDVSGPHGYIDAWVVKMDQNGVIEWQRMYGGSNGDLGGSIIQTKDGGYIFLGHAYSNDGDISNLIGLSDCWIVKIDASGEIEWERCYSSGQVTVPVGIVQVEDGGYVVGASGSISDYWIFKIDAQGEVQWEKFYGGSNEDRMSSIKQTLDKGFILAGLSYSNDGDVTGHHGSVSRFDYWVVKTDSLGTMEWQKSLGGSFNDAAYKVLVTSDGGYLVAGQSQSNDWDVSGLHGPAGLIMDIWVVKLDAHGNIIWSRTLGGSKTDNICSLIESSPNDYLLAGTTGSSDGDLLGLSKGGESDGWIVKMRHTGDIIWQKVLGGTATDIISDLVQTTDGGFAMAGISNSTDGDVTVPIHPSSGSSWYDIWVVKLNLLSGTEDRPTGSLQVFPNPFSGSFSVIPDLTSSISQFSLFNVCGQKVLQSDSYNGKPMDGSFLPVGWYLLRAQTENGKTLQAKLLKAEASN